MTAASVSDPRVRDSAFVRAARGEAAPHTPVWFMRQAGRSLPEYRRVREGVPMLESCTGDAVVEGAGMLRSSQVRRRVGLRGTADPA